LFSKVAKWATALFIQRNELAVESDKSEERNKRKAETGKGPIGDEIEFREGRAVAILFHVIAKPFKMFLEEVAFLWVKRKAVLFEDLADAAKVVEASERLARPKKAIIHDVFVTH
jgi:hypothetical protein